MGEICGRLLISVIDIAVLLFEIVGVALIIYGGIRGLYFLITRGRPKEHWLKPLLLALSFLLFAEILETVLIHDLSQLLVIGGLFALRAGMVIFINWEIKHDQDHEPNK